MSPPHWLTREYVENALSIHHATPELQLNEFELTNALGKGENYGGILTRLRVSYKLNTNAALQVRHLILKSAYENDPKIAEIMRPYDIFNREMHIYEQVLPRIHQLLHEINDKTPLFPTALHVDYKRQAILLEDLGAQGFIMADRVKRLDLAHVQLLLRKLAKMHATSAILNERSKGTLEAYDRGFFNRYTDNYRNYFVGSLWAFAQNLITQPSLAYYGHKLLQLVPNFMEFGKRCFAPMPAHVNVLVHGDVWTNNVMYKYDIQTGEPIDVMIIDFQYACWGSPALDLHHFFNTSMQEPLRLHQEAFLVQHYHRVFAEVLRKLNYQANVPTLRQFSLQFEEKRFFSVYAALVAQPVMLNGQTEDADFMALMADDMRARRFKAQLYENPIVKNYVRHLLPKFDQRGLLDANVYHLP